MRPWSDPRPHVRTAWLVARPMPAEHCIVSPRVGTHPLPPAANERATRRTSTLTALALAAPSVQPAEVLVVSHAPDRPSAHCLTRQHRHTARAHAAGRFLKAVPVRPRTARRRQADISVMLSQLHAQTHTINQDTEGPDRDSAIRECATTMLRGQCLPSTRSLRRSALTSTT